MFHFSVLVSQLENQFSFHKELRSYSSQPRPLARRVPNKSPAPSVGAIYSESSAVIACFSPLKKKKKQQKKRWNWVHNKACSAACDTGVHRKQILNETVASHGQNVPAARGKDRGLFFITAFIHLVLPWSGVNLHASLEIYGLICIISCAVWKTVAHYHNLSEGKKVAVLSCSRLVRYSQIHCGPCYSGHIYPHNPLAGMLLRKETYHLHSPALAPPRALFADVSRFPLVLHCAR